MKKEQVGTCPSAVSQRGGARGRGSRKTENMKRSGGDGVMADLFLHDDNAVPLEELVGFVCRQEGVVEVV